MNHSATATVGGACASHGTYPGLTCPLCSTYMLHTPKQSPTYTVSAEAHAMNNLAAAIRELAAALTAKDAAS